MIKTGMGSLRKSNTCEYDSREMSAFVLKISSARIFASAFYTFRWTCGVVRSYGQVSREGFNSYPKLMLIYILFVVVNRLKNY